MASTSDITDDADVANSYPCVREFAFCACNRCLPIFNEPTTSGLEGSFSSSVETSRPTGLEVQDDQDQKVPNVSHQQTTPPRQNIGTEILARALETVMENPSKSLELHLCSLIPLRICHSLVFQYLNIRGKYRRIYSIRKNGTGKIRLKMSEELGTLQQKNLVP